MPPKKDLLRPDLIGPHVHTGFIWGLALGLFVVWFLAHALSRRLLHGRLTRTGGFFVRLVIGAAGIWAFWQAVSRHLFLESSWSLWTSAFIGSLAVEIIVGLYRLEQKIVAPRLGRWLLGLRLLLVAAVLTILAQPVFSWNETVSKDRTVVVLLDDSGSMQIADRNMTVDERLTLADYAGVEVVKDRSPLPRLFQHVQELADQLEKESISIQAAAELAGTPEKEIIESRADRLKPLLDECAQWTVEVEEAMKESRREQRDLPDDLKRLREELRKEVAGRLRENLKDAVQAFDRRDAGKLRTEMRRAANQISQTLTRSGPFLQSVDDTFYKGVPEDARQKIDAVAARPRVELAKEIVMQGRGGKPSIIEQLQEKYTVRFMQFGKKSTDVESLADGVKGDPVFRSRTDLTGALTHISDSYEQERLAGVLLLSDCRHNGDRPPDDAALSLARHAAPICPVVVGSARGAKDAAIISLSNPQSIFLGDRMRVKAEIKADGMRGQELKVRLLKDGNQVSEETIKVPEDYWRTAVRLTHEPKEKGINSWSVKVDTVDGELFPENNAWSFDAAVSDDRTNVLLIDDRPRWEFRYLRNLFDSRDKSVHLQYVLLHPDEVQGAGPRPDIPASVARKFGDSEATRLPASPEEWRKFDVIILGDIPPGLLGDEAWKNIREAVGDRGAMLVVISGPNHMPHGYSSPVVHELLPVKWEPDAKPQLTSPENAWRFTLTASGRTSPIFVQSQSGVENLRIWEEMPLMNWRRPLNGIRDGAAVLAYARPVQVDAQGNPLGAAAAQPQGDPALALKRQQEMEMNNATVVTGQVDLGKVCFISFDQTWRFRYGVGDTYHHRFWGQLLRWGAGENLPVGTDLVRMGTTQFTYEPGQKPIVLARLVDEQFRPIADKDVYVTVWRGNDRVLKRKLSYRPDSNGMYAAELEPMTEAGDYRLELSGAEVESLLSRDGATTLEQRFKVTDSGNPVEIGDISVDRSMAGKLASLSRGQVAEITAPEKVLSLFGAPSREVTEIRERSLWDNWWILLLAVTAASAEWILRRRGGLV